MRLGITLVNKTSLDNSKLIQQTLISLKKIHRTLDNADPYCEAQDSIAWKLSFSRSVIT